MGEKFLKKQWFPVGGHEKLFADLEFRLPGCLPPLLLSLLPALTQK